MLCLLQVSRDLNVVFLCLFVLSGYILSNYISTKQKFSMENIPEHFAYEIKLFILN